MYGGTCSVIWIEYLRSHRRMEWRKLFLFAWLLPVIMGGIIEIVQEQCTATRSGEWLDFASNTAGATLANLAAMLMSALRIKVYKMYYMLILLCTLTFKQIAELQDIPEATAKSRYRYAIMHLKNKLRVEN